MKSRRQGKTLLRIAPNAAAPGGWAPVEMLVWLATGATFPSTLDGIEMAREAQQSTIETQDL